MEHVKRCGTALALRALNWTERNGLDFDLDRMGPWVEVTQNETGQNGNGTRTGTTAACIEKKRWRKREGERHGKAR